MKSIIITSFLLLLCFSLQAQDYDYSDAEEKEKKERTGYQLYIVEYLADQVEGLDDLPENGYNAMNTTGYIYRLRYGFGKKKLSPIVDLSYYFRETIASSTTANSANIRSFGIGVGHDFNLVDKDHFFIKPMYLLNFSWYKINFTENILGDNLTDILNSDYKEFTFRSFQVPIQAGLNTGVRFNYNETNFGLLVGTGYIFNYHNTNWKVGQDYRISDNIDLSSLYLTAGFLSTF